jgi:arylsulfatase A-like enzyme
MAYRVRVPEQGRVDVALGVLSEQAPVTFAVTATLSNGTVEKLFEERYADPDQWAQRSVDLSKFAGRTVTLTLEAQAEQPGTVALWGAPTVSGARTSDKPNIIFYVIDGGWPDDMSVYGYNRRTTPNLERLAAEGALFEHAYSNTPRTSTSTPSFMTSLQNSVLGQTRQFAPIPTQVLTMAERFHAAGYQTAVFTSNPNAGSPSNLERGVDLMQDTDLGPQQPTSVALQSDYWSWRDAFRGEPYWVHFQTTDVHFADLDRVPGFRGLYTTEERRREYYQERARLAQVPGRARADSEGFRIAGVNRAGFMETLRGLYDESLAQQDHQIGRLVERLKERGEWEHTLLIVASDHGIEAVNFAGFGGLLQDTLPAPWTHSLLRGSVTRVPLIFVWPGHIEGGRRFEAPVSMIDVLPTVLDLTGLPMPDVMQGQSLAPLLRGEPGWTPRPVIMDYFEADPQTGQLRGYLDVIDGRWGASMYIGPPPADSAEHRPWPGADHRPWPVLLFDVWEDPLALYPINEQRPDLVEKYTSFLEQQWEDHQALATRFTTGEQVVLTPQQLERLRALGYIR